jgi:hypothetical protein
VSDEEYQGFQVVGKVASVTPHQHETHSDTTVGFDINTQLFLTQADYEQNQVVLSDDPSDQTPKYNYSEYPLLAKNLDISDEASRFPKN